MDDMIRDLILLQEGFNKYYGKGLVGISEAYIQITLEAFKDLCPADSKISVIMLRNHPIELRYIENNVTFLTLI